MSKYIRKKNWIYAMYKGDTFLCEGTREEICQQMNIARRTFNYYRTKHWIVNRANKINNRRIIIRIDGDDKLSKYFTNFK